MRSPYKFSLCLLILSIGILSACSYDSEKAAKNGDIINMNGPVYNFSRFQLFLDNIDTKKTDSVRITNYTLEGDPILYNLTFNGSAIDFEMDRSKVKDSGNDPTIVSMSCTNLTTKDGQQVITYTLEDCDVDSSAESFTVLSILKDQEDEHEH